MIFPLYLINCNNYKQEYIPLGYVPPSAVVVSGKGSLHVGVSAGGGGLPRAGGVKCKTGLPRRVYTPWADTPLWTDRRL